MLGKEYVSRRKRRSRRPRSKRVRPRRRRRGRRGRRRQVEGCAEKASAVGFGDPGIKAQIFGKKSCPWSGRAITLLEKHKVDFDWVDLEEPENEAKLVLLQVETKQHTVPFVYLRGAFIGGFNALAEVELARAARGRDDDGGESARRRRRTCAAVRDRRAAENTDETAPAEE